MMRFDGRLVFKHTDGSVELFTPGDDPALESTDEKSFWDGLEAILRKTLTRLSTAQRVAVLPASVHAGTDRTFRAAWTWTTPAPVIDIDMGKAVEIHKDNLRALRAPKLAALDVQFMKAIEAGDTKAQAVIAAQKQALRDVTAHPAIIAAKTPEQLKSAIPDVLR